MDKVIEINLEAVEQALQELVDQFPSKEEAARSLGTSRVYLWKMQTRRKPISNHILKKLGFKKTSLVVNEYIKLEDW